MGFGLTTADGRQPRIAIVDGNTTSAIVATALVEQFGCTSEVAGSGEAILSLLRTDRPVDVVLLDLSIQDMNGGIAAQSIRALGSKGTVPIIALTGDHPSACGSNTLVGAFAGAVAKPYSPRDLHAALQSALATGAASVSGHA